jgi:cyanophycinase-like exopeptidase
MASFALLGSGEFEPWTGPIDRWLLERGSGDGRVIVLPTASAPEGDEVFQGWASMGLRHYAEAGIPVEVIPLRTRADAERTDIVAGVRGASAVFFSGGNPAYLAATLANTPAWRVIREEMDRGMAYAGCSAGVACLGEAAPDSSIRDPLSADGSLLQPGLGMFPGTFLMPHWDALDGYIPGLQALIRSSVPADRRLVTIDEHTAILGDGIEWTVVGAGDARVIRGEAERVFATGTSFTESMIDRAGDDRDVTTGNVS